MTVNQRIIFHLDLDAFFAAVEIRDDPKLQGIPVIIGADPKEGKGRGVVTTCSYEARKYGLHSAMPISQAYKLCSHGVYLRGNYEKYQKVSYQVMSILKSYQIEFQQASIDEAYMDFTRSCGSYQDAYTLAESIQKTILERVGITCSIGISSTKSIAKIASDFNKPNGITIVEPQKIQEFLNPMDITKIPGIGKKSKLGFHKKGIYTINDLYKTGLSNLVAFFGDHGVWIWNVIGGNDSRPVGEFYNRKSIGKERTFTEDVTDHEIILQKIHELNSRIHEILEKQKYRYSTITLKIRLSGFATYTRSKTLKVPFRDKLLVEKKLQGMFNHFSRKYTQDRNSKIRLIGIRFSNLEQDASKIQTQITDYL